MKIISFIERRQTDVIQRILRHCGLWEGALRTLATTRAPPLARTPSPAALELVPNDEFLEYRRRENQQNQPGELQLEEKWEEKWGHSSLYVFVNLAAKVECPRCFPCGRSRAS